MIAKLTGKVVEPAMTSVIIDVNGVGYLVQIPVSTYDALPREGETVTLFTHFQMSEDAVRLYGFATKEEQNIFELLITVTGIGAKTALNILSSMNIPSFCAALANGDVHALKKINGVGQKSAERMVVELKEKISKIATVMAPGAAEKLSPEIEDALRALEQLGFQRAKVEGLVTKIAAELPEKQRSSENVIRNSLRALNK